MGYVREHLGIWSVLAPDIEADISATRKIPSDLPYSVANLRPVDGKTLLVDFEVYLAIYADQYFQTLDSKVNGLLKSVSGGDCVRPGDGLAWRSYILSTAEKSIAAGMFPERLFQMSIGSLWEHMVRDQSFGCIEDRINEIARDFQYPGYLIPVPTAAEKASVMAMGATFRKIGPGAARRLLATTRMEFGREMAKRYMASDVKDAPCSLSPAVC